LEENNRVMNNMKFIGRYLALGAVLAGVSASANAQVCGDPVFCGGNDGPFTSGQLCDSVGPRPVPSSAQNFPMSVPQFNPADYAALHGTTADKIILERVEVSLKSEATDFDYTFTNTDSGTCTLSLNYAIEGTILPNATVGTGQIGVQLDLSNTSNPLNNGESVNWTLASYPAAVLVDEECTAQGGDLSAWSGNGNINWTYRLLGIRSETGCTQGSNSFLSTARAEICVEYTYCVEGDDPDPEGCACDEKSPDYRRPGSLLLFPEFDSRPGSYTVLTVTNTDCLTDEYDGEDVDVHFYYIRQDNCSDLQNRVETLTPCDTLSVLSSHHTGSFAGDHYRGFVYAFAVDKSNPTDANPVGAPISYNHLVGSQAVIHGYDGKQGNGGGIGGFDYQMNPVVFRSPQPYRAYTDLDGAGEGFPVGAETGDGYRDLDDVEYEAAPNVITIPRFFGQEESVSGSTEFLSELILIGLSGGSRFETTVDFTIWNDNEVPFSAEKSFVCWERVELLDIDFAFAEWFLDSTDNDLDEVFGHSDKEAGWICITGKQAISTQETIPLPAIYAVLIEYVGEFGVSDLPWECGRRTNGSLIPLGIFGDPDDDTDGDGDVDGDDAENGDGH